MTKNTPPSGPKLQTEPSFSGANITSASLEKLINISSLKTWARSIPPSPLKDILLSEDSLLETPDFVTKIQIWLRLAELKSEK